MKRLLYSIYKKILFFSSDVYDRIPFTVKSRKVKKFDQIAGNGKMYYTISMGNQGFTHILIRTNFYLSLAAKMKMKYIYTSLQTDRMEEIHANENDEQILQSRHFQIGSSQQQYNNIYDFTGISDFLKELDNKTSEKDFNKIIICPDEIKFSKAIGKDFYKLASDLKARISGKLNPDKDNLIIFKNFNSFYRFYFADQHETVKKNFFRLLYLNKRAKESWPSLFDDSKIKLLVHIRQGDTATVQTPWNSLIPTWHRFGEKRLMELQVLNNIQSTYVIGVKDFYDFLRKLYSEMIASNLSTVVFSDGFDRAFDKILSEKKDLSNEKTYALKQLKKNYNAEQFNDFNNWQQVKTVIGEEKEKLYSMVHSFLEANVVITGTQQAMIPKLLSLYCTPENMPILITLFKDRPPNHKFLGIDNTYKHQIQVDLNNYNIRNVAEKMKDYLDK